MGWVRSRHVVPHRHGVASRIVYENIIAGYLLKAVHLWTGLDPGEFELFFLRTKGKREVDFLLIKIKSSSTK
jgi:hypothetical protein